MTNWLKISILFSNVNRRSKFDVIHGLWLDECSVVARVLGWWYGIRTVFTIMGQDSLRPHLWLGRRMARSSRLVACSEFVKTHVKIRIPLSRIEVVHWGILDVPLTVENERTIDILGVGSLIALKRYDVFVEMVKELVHRGHRIQSVLVGDGPERNRIEKLIRTSGMDETIRMTGQLERPNVRRLMEKSRILLHPAVFEAQGLVILEALAAGMYVVCQQVSDPFHDKMKRLREPEEMIDELDSLLRSSGNHDPVNVPGSTDTAAAYRRLYEE